jgi:hypothetical protein
MCWSKDIPFPAVISFTFALLLSLALGKRQAPTDVRTGRYLSAMPSSLPSSVRLSPRCGVGSVLNVVLPLIICISDWIEGAGILTMIAMYPERLDRWATLTSWYCMCSPHVLYSFHSAE